MTVSPTPHSLSELLNVRFTIPDLPKANETVVIKPVGQMTNQDLINLAKRNEAKWRYEQARLAGLRGANEKHARAEGQL